MPQLNAAHWLVDRQVEAGGADRPAVLTPSRQLTYGELQGLTGAAAAGLRSLGLRRDDRVIFVTADDVPMFTGILGAMRGGLVAVPISTMLGPRELGEVINDSGATVVVASAPFAHAVGEAVGYCPDVRHVVWDGPGVPLPQGVGSSDWDELVATGRAADAQLREVVATDEDSWALWLYTSGTTGKPKGAMHRHLNIRLVCDTYGQQVLGITAGDRCLSVAKLFFAYGIGNSMFFPLSVGASVVLEPARPTPRGIADRAREGAPTLFFGVPTFFAGLVNSDVEDDAFSTVRLAASAGEALPEGVQRRVRERFGMPIIDGIGSTECLHIFLSNTPEQITPGTTGVAVPGYELALKDFDGRPVPDGEPGTLWVRGDSIALGYWRRTTASRTVFQGEWLNTGDTYVHNADGTYTCLGRSSDLLKAGGIWVSPTEVENRLLEHEAVLECAVVALQDRDGLEKPVAVVVASDAVSADDLDRWCREGLAPFKRPRQVFFVDELPKTATGKMQRFKVRRLVGELSAREVAS